MAVIDGYFEDVVIRQEPSGVRLLEWGSPVLISPELYERACSGEYPQVRAGEGLLVIEALNGTFRYRLTGDTELHTGGLVAEQKAGPVFGKGSS